MTSSSAVDDSSNSATSPASTDEKDPSSPAEDMGAERKDESQLTGPNESVSTSEPAPRPGQTDSQDVIQNEGFVNYRAHIQNFG